MSEALKQLVEDCAKIVSEEPHPLFAIDAFNAFAQQATVEDFLRVAIWVINCAPEE